LGLLAVLLVSCGEPEVARVAAILPLTGPSEIYGQPVKKGIELAFEELQGSGALQVPFELTVVDSTGDPTAAASLMEAQISQGAFVVIGGVTSSEAVAMVPVADRFDHVLLSPTASTPQLTGISRNFYRVFPSEAREATTMGSQAAQKLDLKTVVMVARREALVEGVHLVFRSTFESYGGEVLELIEYPEGAGDFSGLMERAVTLGPQAVHLTGHAGDLQQMIVDLRDQGFDGPILTTSAFASPQAIEQTGDPANGVLLTQAAFDPESSDAKIQSFVAQYRERHGFAPDLYAAHGFDAMMVVAAAAKDGLGVPESFWKRLRSLRDFQGVTGPIQFNERGDVQKFPRLYRVADGKLEDYENFLKRKREELERLADRIRRVRQGQRQDG
jgi:branched-chain amino acid transport system substrate-binding protein